MWNVLHFLNSHCSRTPWRHHSRRPSSGSSSSDLGPWGSPATSPGTVLWPRGRTRGRVCCSLSSASTGRTCSSPPAPCWSPPGTSWSPRRPRWVSPLPPDPPPWEPDTDWEQCGAVCSAPCCDQLRSADLISDNWHRSCAVIKTSQSHTPAENWTGVDCQSGVVVQSAQCTGAGDTCHHLSAYCDPGTVFVINSYLWSYHTFISSDYI